MPTSYCYRCPECGHLFQQTGGSPNTLLGAPCRNCTTPLIRDYRAEAVGFSGIAEMGRQRELGLDGDSGRKAQRDLFLPTAADMRSPTDPTGQKGLREWADTHRPKVKNVKPLYPEMERKYY